MVKNGELLRANPVVNMSVYVLHDIQMSLGLLNILCILPMLFTFWKHLEMGIGKMKANSSASV